MKHISSDIRGAVTGFMMLLCKGLLDDERWDWDVEKADWKSYHAGFNDPTILKTTLAVFLNNLMVDDMGAVVNYEDARFRGFQYFRTLVDTLYTFKQVLPSFSSEELDEPNWYEWEG